MSTLRMMAQSAVPAGLHLTSINQSTLANTPTSVSQPGSMQPLPTSQLPSVAITSSLQTAPTTTAGTIDTRKAAVSGLMPSSAPTQTSSIRLSPLLGVAPLGPKKLTKEHHHQAEMLMAAYQHVPHPSDSERLRYGCLLWYVIGFRTSHKISWWDLRIVRPTLKTHPWLNLLWLKAVCKLKVLQSAKFFMIIRKWILS